MLQQVSHLQQRHRLGAPGWHQCPQHFPAAGAAHPHTFSEMGFMHCQGGPCHWARAFIPSGTVWTVLAGGSCISAHSCIAPIADSLVQVKCHLPRVAHLNKRNKPCGWRLDQVVYGGLPGCERAH